MLPSQFLDVVLEENHLHSQWVAGENNNVKCDVKLPDALLAECTLELCSSKSPPKKSVPKLSFEARVTPIYPYLQNSPLVTTEESGEEERVDPLLEVEAVYSEDEDDGGVRSGVGQQYKCEHCPNAYSNRGALWQHSVASHSASKNCECSICGRRFYRNCSLALHLKSHAQEDELLCPPPPSAQSPLTLGCNLCGREFGKASSLERHSRVCERRGALDEPEEPPRPHQCHFCKKSYSQKSVLKKHLVIHTGERLTCGLCGIDFTQKSSLLRHMKRMHSYDEALQHQGNLLVGHNIRIPQGISISLLD